MIPPNDPRWKIGASIPTVKLPMPKRFPPHGSPYADEKVLARQRIYKSGGWLEATSPADSAAKAEKDGSEAAKQYQQQDPWGNSASVLALIEWQEPTGKKSLWSAVVNKIHSDS
jgi:hypothetical protein